MAGDHLVREGHTGNHRRRERKQRPSWSLVLVILVRMGLGLPKHFPARAGEWAAATMLFNWGLILLAPTNVFEKSEAYRGLSVMAPEEVWGWGCLAVGGIRLAALFINGTFSETKYGKFSPHVRGLLAFASCFFWVQITVGMVNPEGSTTGLAVYPVLIVLDLWNAARAWFDAGQVDGVKSDGGT